MPTTERLNEYGQSIGWPIADWKPRPLPPRAPMSGRHCRVEPVDVDRDAAALFDAYAAAPDGRDWTYLFVGPFADRASYREHLSRMARTDDPLHHTIVDLKTGSPVGTAALMRIDPSHGVIEVGHIAGKGEGCSADRGTAICGDFVRDGLGVHEGAGGEGDLRACLGKGEGNGAANAFAPAGNEGAFVEDGLGGHVIYTEIHRVFTETHRVFLRILCESLCLLCVLFVPFTLPIV